MLVITSKTVIWWPTKMSKIRQKSPSIYPIHHQLSSKCFWHTKPKVERKQNQNQICSKLFLDQKNQHHSSRPKKNRRPGFPVMRKKSRKIKKICLSLWSISVNFLFHCLSYSCLSKQPQASFFQKKENKSFFNFSLCFLSLTFTPQKNGGSVLIKPISDNTLFSNRSPDQSWAWWTFICMPRPPAKTWQGKDISSNSKSYVQ